MSGHAVRHPTTTPETPTRLVDSGGIAYLTAKGAAGQTGLSKAAAGRALRRLEEAGLVISDGDGDAWRTSAGVFAGDGGGSSAPGQGVVPETAGSETGIDLVMHMRETGWDPATFDQAELNKTLAEFPASEPASSRKRVAALTEDDLAYCTCGQCQAGDPVRPCPGRASAVAVRVG